MFDAWSPLAARRGEGAASLGLGLWPGQARVGHGGARAMCVSQAAPGYRTPSAPTLNTILSPLHRPVKVITAALIIFIGAIKDIYEPLSCTLETLI